MSATPRFWPASRAAARRRVSRRGFLFVAGAHLAAVVGVILLSTGPAKTSVAAGRKTPPAADSPALSAEEVKAVVWMDPATFESPPPPAATPPAPEELTEAPEPPPPRPAPVREPFLTPTPRPAPARVKPAVVAPAKSPRRPPTPPSPVAKSRPPDRPIANRPRLKPFVANSDPAANDDASRTPGPDPGADANRDNSPAGAGGTDWYASMLHERFHARWEQPTSVFATTRRYTATLRLRIERDGRISDFRLVRSSGLVPMDESVLAAAARVGRVDPPPSGLLRGGAYVVNVGFVRE